MAPHRIFVTEWLHQLQVRYPWAGGYAAAPLLFIYSRNRDLLPSYLLLLAKPLIPGSEYAPLAAEAIRAYRAGTTAAFTLHFLRRLAEVIFINDYTGTWARDSRGEIIYYSLWGLLAGACVGQTPLLKFGAPAAPLRTVGLTLFVIGQAGNFWCHQHLRSLRAARGKLGSSQYIIPTAGPCTSTALELSTRALTPYW
jgi:hypothetical protein